jgi:prepilin-type N-terminal cleavage/methylation domain-containing protein
MSVIRTALPVESCRRGRQTRGRGAGFTLLEVLLSLAIIALVSTLLVGAARAMLNDQPVTPEDVFWKTVQEARKTALKSQHDVALKFDSDKKRFLLLDPTVQPAADPLSLVKPDDVPLKEFPLPAKMSDVTIDLLSGQKGGPTILVGGVAIETHPLTSVTFYPDGTCTAFRAQFTRLNGSHQLSIDPWTCAPVLTRADQNAP